MRQYDDYEPDDGFDDRIDPNEHWSDRVEDPDEPERPHFIGRDPDTGKSVYGFLATCKDCGAVFTLRYPEYSYDSTIGWSCRDTEDEKMIEACRAKARVMALKADLPAIEAEENQAERAYYGSGGPMWDDFGGDY
jgi:hypothetical protein